MPSSTTTYTGSGVQNQNDANPLSLLQGQLQAVGGIPNGLDQALQYKLSLAAQRQAFQQQQAQQDFGLRKQQLDQSNFYQGQQNQMAGQAADQDSQLRKQQLAAMQQQAQGTPIYLKPMTGFNMSGGYGRASAGDPGAVFGGYAPPGSMPQSASFSGPQSRPAAQDMSRSTGGYDPTAPVAQAPQDSAGDRYFKQFGSIPSFVGKG